MHILTVQAMAVQKHGGGNNFSWYYSSWCNFSLISVIIPIYHNNSTYHIVSVSNVPME